MKTIISRVYHIIQLIATRSAIHLVRCCHGQMSLIAVSYPIIFIHGFSFNNLVALCAENSEILTCCANFGMDFVGVHSRLAPISSNVSSVKTVCLRFRFFVCHRTSGFEFLHNLVNCKSGRRHFTRERLNILCANTAWWFPFKITFTQENVFQGWIKSNGNSLIFLILLYWQGYNIYVPLVYTPVHRWYWTRLGLPAICKKIPLSIFFCIY